VVSFSSHSAVEKKMIKKLIDNPALFIDLDESWLKNNEFVKTMLSHLPFLIEFAKFHRHDINFIQQLLNDISIAHEKKKLWLEIIMEEAQDLIPEIVHQNPLLIEFVSPEYHLYSKLLLLTVLEKPSCLQRLIDVRENRAFCKLITDLVPEAIRYVSEYNQFLFILENPELFEYLKADECRVYNDLFEFKNVLVSDYSVISHCDSEHEAIALIKNNPWQFMHLPEYLRVDEEVVKHAVRAYPLLIQFADESVKYNLGFLKKIIPEINYPQTRFNNMFNHLANLDGTKLTDLIANYPWIMSLMPRDVGKFNFLLGIAVLRDARVLKHFADYCHDYVFIRSVIVENTDVINMLGPEMAYQMIYELPHLIRYLIKPSLELQALASYRQEVMFGSSL
jgi:hypothetical protein